ncbi:MAG: helix-turn-helix domain-containing protein [Pseudobutyrivibrio sp.]|nr:helix-turn-helix domain-containing protein [Pseudobutyrivibrio sp.]
MNIGNVIRKYRKELGLTQEEMAVRLGVTTPAVNKWENNNTQPDISMVVPIARLLGISTDELLSYKEELTPEEAFEYIGAIRDRLLEEPFDIVFLDAKRKIEEFPNSEILKLYMTTALDSARVQLEVENSDSYDENIISWFTQLIESQDDNVKRSAVGSLFHLYERKGEYEKAEKYLDHMSDENPNKKVLQANVYAKTDRKDEAYTTYEQLIWEEVANIRIAINAFQTFCIEENNLKLAHKLADINGKIANSFDMGIYHEVESQLDIAMTEKDVAKTAKVIKKLIDNCGTIMDFTKSDLYAHIYTKSADKELENHAESLRKDLIRRFAEDKALYYMKGNEYWESLKKLK